MHRRLALALSGLVVMAAGPGWAGPAPGPRAAVLVYPPHLPPAYPGRLALPAPAEVAASLRQALAAQGMVAVDAPVEAALAARAAAQRLAAVQHLAAAERLLAEGRRLLAQVELEQAETVFSRAEDEAQAALALPEAPGRYAEALRWRGVALLELRRSAEAARSFRRALAIQPEVRLTEAEVRPDVVRAFARAAEGAGARVPPPVAVPDGGEGPLLRLRQAPDAGGLGALCAALDLDSVVLAAAAQDGGEAVLLGQRFHCAAAAATPVRQVHLGAGTGRPGDLGAAADRLVAQLWQSGFSPRPGPALDLLAQPALAHPRPPPPPRPAPWYRRPWVWLAAGAISAGVVLGASLWPRPPPRTTLVVTPSDFALRF